MVCRSTLSSGYASDIAGSSKGLTAASPVVCWLSVVAIAQQDRAIGVHVVPSEKLLGLRLRKRRFIMPVVLLNDLGFGGREWRCLRLGVLGSGRKRLRLMDRGSTCGSGACFLLGSQDLRGVESEDNRLAGDKAEGGNQKVVGPPQRASLWSLRSRSLARASISPLIVRPSTMTFPCWTNSGSA